jgi:hypothetical protein
MLCALIQGIIIWAPRKIPTSKRRSNQIQASQAPSAGGWRGKAWFLRFERRYEGLDEKTDPLVAIAGGISASGSALLHTVSRFGAGGRGSRRQDSMALSRGAGQGCQVPFWRENSHPVKSTY